MHSYGHRSSAGNRRSLLVTMLLWAHLLSVHIGCSGYVLPETLIMVYIRVARASGLLDWLNLAPPQPRQPTLSDFTSQGLGLVNYFAQSLRRNPVGPAPQRQSPNTLDDDEYGQRNYVPLQQRLSRTVMRAPDKKSSESIPIVPEIAQQIPGVGECLPSGTPLVNSQSPSLVQNFLREVPLAQGVLRSFSPTPDVDYNRLMGKWHWVLTSDSDTEHHYKPVVASTQAGSFSVLDKFLVGSPYGQPKVGFGYGVAADHRISVYTQSDPCPYQIVALGPVSSTGQYEYVILSNWVKYPVVGMIRDLRTYGPAYERMNAWLRQNGYMNVLTDTFGSFTWRDWNACAEKTSTGNIVGNILQQLFFGRQR